MKGQGGITAFLIVLLLCTAGTGCTGTSGQSKEMPPEPAPVAVSLHMKGFNSYINGNYTAALEQYDQSLAADPAYTRAWMDKGNLLLRMNRTEEAISAYDAALALDSNLPLVWNGRGEALMAQGNYTGAIDSFDRALALAPEYTVAKENRERAVAQIP